MNTNPKVQEILNKAAASGERVLIDGAYDLTNEGEVVKGGDASGAFVLVGENGSLPQALAEELKLPIRKDDDKQSDPAEEPSKAAETVPDATHSAVSLQNDQEPAQVLQVGAEKLHTGARTHKGK